MNAEGSVAIKSTDINLVKKIVAIAKNIVQLKSQQVLYSKAVQHEDSYDVELLFCS